MLSVVLSTVLLCALSAQTTFGQFTNNINCYYCTDTFIPGNPGVITTGHGNPYGFGDIDNGCGYPFNATGSGVIQVSCPGVCVTQLSYDPAGKNHIVRMCSLVEPSSGCFNSTHELLPRVSTCTHTCSSSLCNGVNVPYVIGGVSAVLPQCYSIASVLLVALAVNFSKLIQ